VHIRAVVAISRAKLIDFTRLASEPCSSPLRRISERDKWLLRFGAILKKGAALEDFRGGAGDCPAVFVMTFAEYLLHHRRHCGFCQRAARWALHAA
jgi:hypothetical protein